MIKKQLFVSSIPIIELQGSSFIPTILFYENDGKGALKINFPV